MDSNLYHATLPSDRKKTKRCGWSKLLRGKKKRKGIEVTRTCLCQTAMPQMCWSDWWEGSLCWRTSFIFPPPLGFLWQNLCHPEFQGFSLLSFVWVFGFFLKTSWSQFSVLHRSKQKLTPYFCLLDINHYHRPRENQVQALSEVSLSQM